mmetsp:Transcript_29401/g.71656  ORF Transcript_29401/g.71656 Transcript_29401/m.71656 type:complete len:204 (-) Transcript_29401:584-1195(-)
MSLTVATSHALTVSSASILSPTLSVAFQSVESSSVSSSVFRTHLPSTFLSKSIIARSFLKLNVPSSIPSCASTTTLNLGSVGPLSGSSASSSATPPSSSACTGIHSRISSLDSFAGSSVSSALVSSSLRSSMAPVTSPSKAAVFTSFRVSIGANSFRKAVPSSGFPSLPVSMIMTWIGYFTTLTSPIIPVLYLRATRVIFGPP